MSGTIASTSSIRCFLNHSWNICLSLSLTLHLVHRRTPCGTLPAGVAKCLENCRREFVFRDAPFRVPLDAERKRIPVHAESFYQAVVGHRLDGDAARERR